MSKTTTLTLVSDMGLSDTTSGEADRIYDDVVRELGALGILTENGSNSVTAATATYTAPTNTIRILEIHGGYGILDQTDYDIITNLLGARFHLRTGRPTIWCHEHETIKDFRLVPIPNESDTLTTIVTQYQANVPVFLEMPIALEVLHREYLRESNHQDIDFALLCRRLATMWFSMLGIIWHTAKSKGK